MSLPNDSLSERILFDLNSIFKRDPQIIEFDIIPVEDKVCNKSPVIHVDHRIGLESWCVRHLYAYTYRKFIDSRIISNNRIDSNLIHEWTRALLLINPDLTTAWNARKELTEKGCLKVINELQFSEVLLTRKPKSPDNFAHREWLIRFLIKSETLSDDLITNELRVSLDASSRYHRNYHAWSHRIWIIDNIFLSLDKLNCDLIVTKCWLETHVSDYSCFQFRQFLFSYIFNHFISTKNCEFESNDETKRFHSLIIEEMDLLNDLLTLYTDQESLFIHRRFILISIAKWFPNEIKNIKDSEVCFIDEQLSNSYSNSKSNQWHLDLIRKHINYLNRNLNWNFDST